MLAEAEVVAREVIQAFDTIGIAYAIGGSVASTVHGIPRLTADVDFIADMREENIEPLAELLQEAFYADGDMMRDAIRNNSSFNVIHLATMVKADIFLLPRSPFAASEWSRRQRKRIGPDMDSPEVFVASPEDMILQKLSWYRLMGERSDRQWGDVQGMLKVQAMALDFAYLTYWAAELAVSGLLQTSLEDAGLEQEKED